MAITADQCHAGRILARVGRDLLATKAGLSIDAVAAFEGSGTPLAGRDGEALQRALEQLGIEFIPEDGGGGAGVRLKFDRAQSRQLSAWESEGGTAADDDVA